MTTDRQAWTSVVDAFLAADPVAPAVTGHFGSFTFGQIGAMAAAAVREIPADREVRVGYLGPRDPAFVAVVLAVLGHGAAWVPLDPAWPAARIAEVAEESGLSLVFTGAEAEAIDLPGVRRVPVPMADGGAFAPAARGGRELAYVVFTSGSTGRPKGVLTEHAALLNNCVGLAERWRLTGRDRVLQFTSLGVDIALEEIFTAWVAGAAVVLMDPGVLTDFGAFTAFLAEHEVSAMDLPTSFWVAWLSALEGGEVPRPPAPARVIAVGSEEVSSRDIVRWHAAAGPHTEVFNMYGSTEQAITSIVHGPVGAGDPVGIDLIGTPLPGVRAYVLDDDLQEMPAGVPGELYVGGLAAARGYVGDSARTAARFRPDPFAGTPGARMYATGDRAVSLTDGSFRFAGRIDDRLKIRGFTVQPREVELLLTEAPEVIAATVTSETGPQGSRFVVASIQAATDDPQALVARLTETAARRLPEPARPRRYDLIDPTSGAATTIRPRTAAPAAAAHLDPAKVEAVTAIWRELLGGQSIGPRDSFLDLGGNSLLVTQLLTRLRSRLGLRVELPVFFADPTVAALVGTMGEVAAQPAPPPIPRTGDLRGPCWPGQERLWFVQRLAPGSTAYHLPMAFAVRGHLDPAALERALHTVVTRHEPLRTALRFTEGALVQAVETPRIRVEQAETSRAADDELARDDGFAASFVARPFRLDEGDVLRAAVVTCAGNERLLLFAMHHVAFDEWSARLFAEELGPAYAAAVSGTEPDLPPLPVRYLDFSTWHTRQLLPARAERLRAFWSDYLRGLSEALPLPADRPAPELPSGEGRAYAFPLGRRVTAALSSLALREGVTRFQVLLTLWAVFLARYTGRDDLVVGVPSAGRSGEELERLIGLFVTTLPVRAALGDNPRFAESVRRVGDSLVAARAAGDLPLEEIARSAGAEGPLFRTMFLTDEERIELDLGGPAVRTLEAPARTSTMDLSLILGDADDGGLAGRLWYSTDLFDERTAERLAASFTRLVDEVVDDPDLRVKDIVLVPEADRALAVGARVEHPTEPIFEQVARAAARWPERVAVVDGERAYTYAELMELVGECAKELAPARDFVPLVLPGGAKMLASMLAVNRLGKAFVPVDPNWPRRRIDDILADLSGATGEGMYAIYTSGSTGRPKAAIADHRGIANRIAWMTREFGAGAAASVLQTTPPVYDSCVWEYFWPLTNGGKTILTGPSAQADPGWLLRLIAEHDVRTIDLVPSMLDGLVAAAEASGAGALEGLHVAVVGGEELSRRMADRFAKLGLPARLYNLYGPTEASIGSMVHRVSGGDEGRVLIGSPIDNTGVVVLDERRQPVARNVIGELYLAGECVGPGYLGDAAQTRRRFVRNPFPEALPGDRLYRTGDLARMRPSGETEFWGRADDQIKIRGVRIEPGEVAAALRGHPGVREAVVIARSRLRERVAALLAAAPPGVAAAALRAVTTAAGALPPVKGEQ